MGPSSVVASTPRTWVVRSSDLAVGDQVVLGWGGVEGPGPCPFIQRVGGHLCMDITSPARPLAGAIAAAHPTLPGVVQATFDVTVPATNLSSIVLQAMKVSGPSSATSNTLTVNLTTTPPPVCNPNGSLGGGSGTAANPYLVCAAQHLRVLDFNQTVHVLQTADVDMSNATQRRLHMKTGSVFDGGGFIIDNYVADAPLIGRVDAGGVVRNVTMRNARVVSGGGNEYGILVGNAEDATLQDLDVEGLLTTSRSVSSNGAIVGFAENCTMERLRVQAEVIGDTNSGLAIGQMRGGTATEVHVSGRVHSFGTSGGIVGLLRDGGEIRHSSATAYLNSNSNIGGIAGSVTAGANVVADSWFNGRISSGGNAGGIAGSISAGSRIESCVAAGEIMSMKGNSVGGLAGSVASGSPTNEVVDSVSIMSVRAGHRFDFGDGDCRVAGLVGTMDGGLATRVIAAPPSVTSPNPVPDLIGGQCGGTRDFTTDAYLIEATPGQELDSFVDVSGAPSVASSYPALDFVDVWAMPSVNPLHPDGLLLPLPQSLCGRAGVVCP